MPSPKIKKNLNSGTYFLTFTIKNWYHIFERHNRWQILAKSLVYCQQNKGLEVNHYVFMPNHIHLIITSADVAGFVRDFKKFTAKKIRKNLAQTEPSALELFINKDNNFGFWEKTNMPIRLETEKIYRQKAKYIEENPVRKNYVLSPELWQHSSANPQSFVKTTALI